MSQKKNCCAFCGISNVPLFLCLDGKMRCADHVGMLQLQQKSNESMPEKEDSEWNTTQN